MLTFFRPPNIEKDNLTAIFPLHFLEAIDLWKYCMCLINNCLDDFSKPLPFFSVWRQCMLRVWLFKWVGGVWRRMCFCPDLVFSSSGSSLFTVRYLQGVLRLSCKKMRLVWKSVGEILRSNCPFVRMVIFNILIYSVLSDDKLVFILYTPFQGFLMKKGSRWV